MSAVELAVLARRRYAAPTQGFGMVIVDRAEDKDIAMADEPGSKATLFSTDVTDDDSFNAAIEQANWVSPEIVEAFMLRPVGPQQVSRIGLVPSMPPSCVGVGCCRSPGTTPPGVHGLWW